MAISKEKKSQILDSLDDKFGRAKSLVFVRNEGLTASDNHEVRTACHENNLDYVVAKHTLIKIAAEKHDIQLDSEVLNGPVGVIFGYEDEVVPASTAFKFTKNDDAKLTFTGGVLGKDVNSAAQVIALAKLPSREQLLATLLARLNGPISGFANVCAGPLRGFAQVVKAISEQK